MEIRFDQRGVAAGAMIFALLMSAIGSVALAGVASASIQSARNRMTAPSLPYPGNDPMAPSRIAPLTMLPPASTPFPDLLSMNNVLGSRFDPVPQSAPAADPEAIPQDQAAVPLPSGATTGAIVLALLGLVGSRKSILHFFR